MLKANITTATTVTADTTVPFNLIYNTNCKTRFSNGAIQIREAGKYDVEAMFVLTGVAAGNVSVQMFNNGTAIAEAVASATSGATTDLITLPILDTLRVARNCSGEEVNLTFQVSEGATINSAIVTVEEIR